MSALSLGKTNGGTRALMKKKHAPAGPVASFIPAPPSSPKGPALEENTKSNILTEKTESICSDDPAPPSSEIFIPAVPAVPKFDLEEAYPSIFVPINLLRLVEGVKDLDRLRSLAQVFATCLQTIIHSMDSLPYDIRLNSTYELAQYGVVFTGGLFAAQVAKIDPDWYAAQVAEGIEMALELMDITMASLRNFLEVAERILVENKPLPALPSEDSAEPLESAPGTLANIVAEVLQSAESTPVTPSLKPVYTSKRKPANNPARKASSQRKDSIIRRILQQTPKASNASTLPSKTESSLTLVGPEFGTTPIVEPSKSLAESGPPNPSYILRQSAVYFLADPYSPEVDVEMPLPAGDTVAVRLDHLGTYKAASLTALVRMLTSKDAVTDPEFTDTFFMCFRMFSSPMQFFELLVKRFDEQPPASLTTVQLRIWTREMMHVRIRVAKTIRIWLTEYWRPEFDSEVLEHLQAFALDRIVGDLPDQLAMRILEGLNNLVNGKEHRGVKRQRQLEIVKYSAMVEEPKPTGFLLVPKSTPQLSQFESKAGREELARQLTIKASEIFFKIDPAEVVIFWKKGKDKGVGSKIRAINSFEKSLGLWVTSTILDQLTQRKRADLIEFWLDISTICVRLRNFSSAHAIYLGAANPAVGRMKHTILRIAIYNKEQYRKLTNMFSGQGNFMNYRNALSENHMPAVPMIAPLLRDVETMKEMPPVIGVTDDSEEKHLINLYAYRIIMKTVRAMESSFVPYKFTSNGYIQEWLDSEIKPFHPDLEEEFRAALREKSEVLEAKDPELPRNSVWLHTMTMVLDKYVPVELPHPSALVPDDKKSGTFSVLLARFKF